MKHQLKKFIVVALGAVMLGGVWSSLGSATSPSFPSVAIATNPGSIVNPVVVKSITVGSTPLGVSSDGSTVWVANELSGTVSSIAAATGTVSSSVTPGSEPNAVSSDGTHVWITNANLNEVSEYTTSGSFVQNFTGITAPQGVSSDGTDVWVTSGTNTVNEINISTSVASTITLPTGSLPLGISSDGANVWVADSGTGKVTQINAASGLIVNTISVGTTPTGVSSDGSDVWVTNNGSGNVSEISTSSATVVHTITVGSNPTGISSDATDVWVANYTSSTVSEIQTSTSTVVATLTLPTGSHPEGVSADGTQVWVADSSLTSVSEIASALSITTSSLLNASTTSAYSQTIVATGGVGAYTWSATGLPSALSINASSGIISGTNPASGNYVVAVTVTDPVGQSAKLYSSIYASTFPTIDVPYYPGNIPNPVVAFNSSTFYEGADANAISVDGNDAWYANLIGYNSGSAPGGTCSQNNGCGSVTEVNLTTGAIVQTLLGGPTSQPSGFPTISACETATGGTCSDPGVFTYPAAIYSDGTYVWIPSFASAALSQYDIATSSFVGSNIAVGTLPSGVYSDGTDVWVANDLSNSVSEIQISPTQSTVINTISLPAGPRGISGDGQYIFAAEGSGKVSVIDKATHSVVTTTNVGLSTDNIYGVSADGTHVWATDQASSTLYELDESGIGYTPASTSANATSTWTVSMTASPTGALSSGGSFTVSFPDSVTIPSNPTVALGSGFTGTCTGATASSSGENVTVTLSGTCALAANTAASLTVAGITNPNSVTTGQAAFGVIQGITNATYLYKPGSVSADGTDVWVANDQNPSSGTDQTPTVTEFSSSTGAFVQAYTNLGGTTNGTSEVVGGVGSTGKDVWVAVGESGSSATNSETVEIKPAPSLASTTLTEVNSNTGTPTQVITATGGQGPFTYGATGLPTGLSINPSTGAISGSDTTPNGSSPSTVTITATDARGNATSITQPLYVDPPPTLTTPAVGVTPAGSFPEAGAGQSYSASLIGGGGTGAGTYTYTASNLPPGLSINASTGVISGTPTAGGTYPVTVTLTDAGGATATLTSNIVVVSAPYITTASPLAATVGNAYTTGSPLVTVQGAGGTGPYSWSATGLPTGLSINPTTGAITGTPTVGGTYTPTITITDAGGLTATKVLTMNVTASPTASMVSATSGGNTTTATFTGSVNPNALSTAVSFCYSTVQANLATDCPTTAGGSATTGATSVSASTTPVSGSTTLSPTANVSGLTPGTTYYVEEQATNADGTTTTSNLNFSTSVAAPIVTDTAASSVLAASAGLNATVNPGGSTTTVAFCYALSSAALSNCPSTASGTAGAGTTVVAASTPTVAGTSPVASTIGISGLSPNTTYYYEAIGTNSVASTTGSPVQNFTTSSVTPLVTASAASSVAPTSATLNGTINPEGASSSVAFCYAATLAALANCPTTATGSPGAGATLVAASTPTVSGSSLLNATAPVTGLLPGATYYYEEIASNSGANATSTPVQSFTTTTAIPVATTTSATPTTTTATVQGTVNPGGASTNVAFCYALTSAALANCPSTATGSAGTGTTVVAAATPTVSGNTSIGTSGSLSGLLPGTQYYVQEIATNSAGSANGSPVSFTTQVALPMSATAAPTSVGPSVATLNGSVNPEGGSTAVSFCYIQATTLSNCAGATTVPISASPILGTTTTPLNASLSGLVPNTSYCYQEVSTNSAGTTYGTPVCFLTVSNGPTITTTSLPSGAPGNAYTTTLTTAGGTSPITFTASGLPPGLSINDLTGVISGTPLTEGNYPVILTATDANNQVSQKTLYVTISATPTIVTTSLPDAPSNGDPDIFALQGGGGTAPDTWTQTGLPSGLTLNPITGLISGIVTAGPGAYPVTITLTDANGLKTTATFTLVVAGPPTITTTSLTSSTAGAPYNSTVAGSGSGPFTWQATGLPTGLSINQTTGVISGTSLAAGTYPISVTLTDAAGQVTMKTFYITIGLKPLVLPPFISSVVHFAENSTVLTHSDLVKIEAVALFMRQHAGYANVVLTGYADPRASRAYNLALGKRRAVVVRAQLNQDLAALRVKGIAIAVVTKGASNFVEPGLSDPARAADRRVVVVVD